MSQALIITKRSDWIRIRLVGAQQNTGTCIASADFISDGKVEIQYLHIAFAWYTEQKYLPNLKPYMGLLEHTHS